MARPGPSYKMVMNDSVMTYGLVVLVLVVATIYVIGELLWTLPSLECC